MSVTVSNPRDLLVQLLGRLLYVERRLAGEVLHALAQAVHDEGLKHDLEQHLAETREHVTRLETTFRELQVAPTSNRSAPFEAAMSQHDELAASIPEPTLADVLHATGALRTEHTEIATYGAILALADAMGAGDAVAPLRESLAEEEAARAALENTLDRLARSACAR
jgi:ferritin-like metal-binding protein YciE